MAMVADEERRMISRRTGVRPSIWCSRRSVTPGWRALARGKEKAAHEERPGEGVREVPPVVATTGASLYRTERLMES